MKEVCSGRPEHSGSLIVMYVIMAKLADERLLPLHSAVDNTTNRNMTMKEAVSAVTMTT